MLLALQSFFEKVAHNIFTSIWEAASIVSVSTGRILKSEGI